jgi:hypothetical protein
VVQGGWADRSAGCAIPGTSSIATPASPPPPHHPLPQFHLALENTRCTDYVTEKLFTAFTRGQVPIVLGAPNVADHSPGPDSFIDATAFPSARALADYLLYLDRNDTAYEQYHAWRRRPFASYGALLAREMQALLPVANGTGVGERFREWYPCLMCEALQSAEQLVPATPPQQRPGCTFGAVPTFEETCAPRHNAWLDAWRTAEAQLLGDVARGEAQGLGGWLGDAVAAAQRAQPHLAAALRSGSHAPASSAAAPAATVAVQR